MKTNFIKALIGTCSGVDIFEQLRTQHGFRTFWHLLLMNFICSIIIGLGLYPEWKKQASSSIERVIEHCGDLRLDKNGITPEKEPEKAKNFLIAGPVSVTYLPPECDVLPEKFDQGCDMGILWSGAHVAVWRKNAEDRYTLSVMGNIAPQSNGKSIAPEDMIKQLRDAPPVKLPEGDSQVLTYNKLTALSKLVQVMAVLMIALFNLTQIFIYIAMFAGVFALMGMGRPRRIKVGEMVKLAIYAGFPAMLIGSVATALRLPLLDFDMVYVLGMTIYLMIAMNRLERRRQEQEWQNNEPPANDRMG